MKYLVLGSEGQIGKHLVEYLRKNNHEVIEYDIKRDPIEDLRALEPNRECKINLLETKLALCDFVFFLAWDVGGSKYLSVAESSFNFIHNNVAIINSVFPLLKKHNKPFIFTSTQMAAMGHSTYGNTKILGEKFTEMLNGIVVRLWNVYGHEKVNKRSHVITDFVEMAHQNGVIRMRTDGAEKRQFLYADDCCKALLVLSELYDSLPRDEKFHVSSNVWTSIEDIAKIVSNYFNCSYIKGDLKDDVQKSIQEEPNKDILKYWSPEVSLIDGIGHIIKQSIGSKNKV